MLVSRTPKSGVPMLVFPYGFDLEKLDLGHLVRSLMSHAVEDDINDTCFTPVNKKVMVSIDLHAVFLKVLHLVVRGEKVREIIEDYDMSEFERKLWATDTRKKVKEAYNAYDKTVAVLMCVIGCRSWSERNRGSTRFRVRCS